MTGESSETLVTADQIYATPFDPPVRALLVRNGKVAALGEVDEVRAAAGSRCVVLEYPGATVTAGFTDAHVHLSSWALARRNVDLGGSASIEEAVARVAAGGSTTAGWIIGHGWNRHLWERVPTRADLDRRVGDTPVFLDSQDLHAAWLNSEALLRCGITRDTPDPEGGRIVRDERGEPTGVLLEDARAAARSFIPSVSEADLLDALEDAQRAALSLGLAGVHSVEAHGLRDFSALHSAGRLQLRVLQHIQLNQLDGAIAVGLRSGFGGDRLSVGGVKMFLDGSLGSRTAWLREPYEGGGEDCGIQTLSSTDFRDAVRRASANGLASTVHAIGDAAVELALDTLSTIPPPRSLPHRIEHLQLCPPDIWARAASSGIIASVQPVHILTDIEAAERNWGSERSRGAYPFAPLLRQGMTLALGSDVPVETLDPRPGLYAATRRGSWGDYERGVSVSGWHPEYALTGGEAVAGYTLGPAIAANQHFRRGALRPGFDADLAVWSRDPVAASPEEYRGMECLMTMIDGEVVHGGAP